MLTTPSLEVTACGKDERRYDGPDRALGHRIFHPAPSCQMRRRNDSESEREHYEEPPDPKRCSHLRRSPSGA
jgi:hypothetical protein